MGKTDFNPNAPGQDNGNFFGLPYDCNDAHLVLIGVPWDVSTSYRPGTSGGPEAIRSASLQVDLFDLEYGNAWEKGIGTFTLNNELLIRNKILRKEAEKVIHFLEQGGEVSSKEIEPELIQVNEGCRLMTELVFQQSSEWLKKDKRVGLIGGDHSCPLGLMKALSEMHDSFGVLHIDAHADLRDSYEGFTYSHASIMFNALKLQGVSRLVQVGIRDLCEDEMNLVQCEERIVQFTDYYLSNLAFRNVSWLKVCEEIIGQLPEKVYVSFDIDGLQPSLCPGTGTPVPGGLSFEQAAYLLSRLAKSGRQIIGFDLSEVACTDSDWDANVGARVLFKLSSMLCSNSTDLREQL